MTIMEGTRELKTAIFDYDFAVDGGAQGDITLRGDDPIPNGAIVCGGYLDIVTQVTSGGAATIAGTCEGAGDIFAATGKASFTTGVKNILPAETTGSVTASTKVKTTAERKPKITVGVADLTAGKMTLVLFYR